MRDRDGERGRVWIADQGGEGRDAGASGGVHRFGVGGCEVSATDSLALSIYVCVLQKKVRNWR